MYLRLLDAIPDEDYQREVVPGMRTPAALVAHVSGGLVRDIACGVAAGEIRHLGPSEAEVARGIRGASDATAYAEKCWSEADAAMKRVGDAELAAVIGTPWNMKIPGRAGVTILHDELLHHRGQLYTYVRLSGGAPPFVWSHGDNPEGFGPKA